MRLRSIVPAIVTSALVAAGALAVVQEASYAAAPAAPHGQVDSFFERQGNGKVCHPIALEDEDSPLEKLIVTITSNPAPNAITLEKNNGYQLCVDTSQPTNLGVVRLRVTDPEGHADLFETTVMVLPAPRTNVAPTGSIPAISVPVSANPGEFCQPATLEDKNHKVEELTMALPHPVEGVSVKGHSLCVDTTKPLAKTDVDIAVSDPEGDATPFVGKVHVFAVPTIEFADLVVTEGEGEGEGGKVCAPVTVADADDAVDKLVITKVSGPDAVTVEGKNLCVSTAKPFDKTAVTLKVEDADKHSATFTSNVVVAPKKADTDQQGDVPQSNDKGKPGDKDKSDNKGSSTPSDHKSLSGKSNKDQGKNSAKKDSPQSLAKTGFMGGTALFGAITLAAIGVSAASSKRRRQDA